MTRRRNRMMLHRRSTGRRNVGSSCRSSSGYQRALL